MAWRRPCTDCADSQSTEQLGTLRILIYQQKLISKVLCLQCLLFCSGLIGYSHSDVIMNTIASRITSVSIVYSTVCSGADQRKHQSSASLAIVWGNHRWPVNSPHKWPVTLKMFQFDDAIMDKKIHVNSLHKGLVTRKMCTFDDVIMVWNNQVTWPHENNGHCRQESVGTTSIIYLDSICLVLINFVLFFIEVNNRNW